MPGWSLRTVSGLREGLSLSELEELIRRGEAGPADEVSQGRSWARVDAIPYLRRHLPPGDASPKPSAPPAPIPPAAAARPAPPRPSPAPSIAAPTTPPEKPAFDPRQVDVLLASLSDAPRQARFRNIGRVLWVVAISMLSVEAILILRVMLGSPGR